MTAGPAQAVRPPKPAYEPFAGLPDLPALLELRERRQWVAWDYVWKPEKQKWDKPPVNARTGRLGSSTDPETWSPYEQAAACSARNGFPGVGFVLSNDGGESGIDLDDCRDPDTGRLQHWAQVAIDFGETYAEVSPSGCGLRFFVKGKIDCKKIDAAQVELYASGRYLTVTGRHIAGTPTEIHEAPRTIAYLQERADQFRAAQKAAAELARESERKRVEKLLKAQADEAPGIAARAAAAAGARPRQARSAGAAGDGDGKAFWRAVNARALANLQAWVPQVLPAAVYHAGTGAYRMPQDGYEEDLSIHPDGIKDWSVHDMGDARDGNRTPIDIVRDYLPTSDAAEAAMWLCERIGVDPATLGWKARTERKPRSGAPLRSRAERQRERAEDAQASDAPPEGGASGGDDGDDQRPCVFVVAGRVPDAADRTEAMLLAAGVQVYARAGTLARPVIDSVPASGGRMTTVARLRPLCNIGLSDLAARVIRFRRYDRRAQEWVDMNPPVELMATLLAREGLWRIPAVAGVITTPTLRPDGTLLTRAGYDAATRLFLALDPKFVLPAIPEHPTRADAERALALISDLLTGFPFVGPTDRAVALSGILTAVVRGTLPVAPLHAIRAHSPGTGKSFLVDIASTIATGRRCPVIAAGKTEEETEKRLGALLRDAVPVVSIDNVNGELGGDMLCQMTERPLIRVRILGRSEAPELEVRSTVFATGNNLMLVGDMTRRTVLCTLDAKVERPELRAFAFDPLERVLADRGAYVAAALTIVRAYRCAGSPEVCGTIGSYAEWSEAVRAPLIWLGQADPVASMEAARDEDPELSAIRELFAHWREHLSLSSGYTTNTIIKTACEKRPGSSYDYSVQEFTAPEFRDLLLRQAGDGGAVNSRRLGKWLSRISGRVVDGHHIEVKVDGSHGNRFKLCPVVQHASQTEF